MLLCILIPLALFVAFFEEFRDGELSFDEKLLHGGTKNQ